jgi:hypothetical protein
MRINDFVNEEKVRLDPSCWDNKKIGNPKTKVKGGVRVNNCVPAESLNEFAPGSGGGESGRWYTDDQMTDIVGDGWWQDLDVSGNMPKQAMIQEAQAWLDDQGYDVQVLNCKLNDDDMEWFIQGSFDNPGFANEGMSENHNPEYNDEAGMADNNLETLERAVRGIDDLIQAGDNLPEWCQEKIAVAKSMLVAVWDYMESEEDSDEVDPEIDAMFEAMDQLAEEMAVKHGVDVDTVWETFEAMDDNMLYETAAWRRKEGKSKSGGLNAKGVASYRRENPGSKLQTAVTTKPSKLKPGSKAAKRRKSFCARMGGVKGPMKKPNGKPTRKALALRKWNC